MLRRVQEDDSNFRIIVIESEFHFQWRLCVAKYQIPTDSPSLLCQLACGDNSLIPLDLRFLLAGHLNMHHIISLDILNTARLGRRLVLAQLDITAPEVLAEHEQRPPRCHERRVDDEALAPLWSCEDC